MHSVRHNCKMQIDWPSKLKLITSNNQVSACSYGYERVEEIEWPWEQPSLTTNRPIWPTQIKGNKKTILLVLLSTSMITLTMLIRGSNQMEELWGKTSKGHLCKSIINIIGTRRTYLPLPTYLDSINNKTTLKIKTRQIWIMQTVEPFQL